MVPRQIRHSFFFFNIKIAIPPTIWNELLKKCNGYEQFGIIINHVNEKIYKRYSMFGYLLDLSNRKKILFNGLIVELL